MIRFEGTLTPDAYRRAVAGSGRPMQIVGWVLILAGAINLWFANLALPVSWAMPIFLVLFGVMLLMMPRMTLKRAFATDKLLSEPITGEADEQGVRMKSAHGAVDLPWALHTVMVAPDLVAIHQSAGTIRIIPRAFFADEESWEAFRRLALQAVRD
jgi:hypothetical protein